MRFGLKLTPKRTGTYRLHRSSLTERSTYKRHTSFFKSKTRRYALACFVFLGLSSLGFGANVYSDVLNKILGPELKSLSSKADIATIPAESRLSNSTAINALSKEKQDVLQQERKKLTETPKEARTPIKLLDQNETTKTFLNNDATITRETSINPARFKVNDKWVDIDTTLKKDEKSGKWSTTQNTWKASFGAMTATTGVEMNKGKQTLTLSPVDGRKVEPTVATVGKKQVVTYKDVWPGVDLKYSVSSTELKESIWINNPDAAKQTFKFKVSGATLTPSTEQKGAYDLDGDLKGYKISASTLFTTEGIVGGEPYLVQSLENNTISMSLDKAWLATQTEKAYPMMIDPTVVDWANQNYASYNNTGYVCGAGMGCGNSTGNNHPYYIWRTVTRTNFVNNFSDKNTKLTNATLYLEMTTPGEIPDPGTYSPKNIYVRHAGALNYNGGNNGYGVAQSVIGSSGNIDVTGIYQNAINNNDYGIWLMINGEESAAYSYKFFDWDATRVTYTYDEMPNPTLSSPENEAVVVMPQPHLVANQTNFHGYRMKYNFKLGTTPDAEGGQVVESGPLDTPQWTVPEGAVSDGTTYYWKVTTTPADYPTASPKTSDVRSFRIDLRNGKNSTQAFDNVGPFRANLNTGNVSMSTKSHSITALAGELGLGLEYNSPMRSQPGLMAEYWNDSANCACFPNSAPTLTRIDGNVQFDWGNGSPEPGKITTDHFLARWTGYFVAPFAGSYKFGADADDGVRIKVDNNMVLDSWGYASPTKRFGGTAVNLTAGQVVPITVEYFDWENGSKIQLFIQNSAFVDANTNPTGERPMLAQWLQTGARNIAAQQGLTGRYYYNSGTTSAPAFPANQDDPTKLFLTRTDGYLSYNWGYNKPSPTGPTDDFLVQWTGYFTPKVTDTYKFRATSDDGVRVWVNNMTTPIIDNWPTPTNASTGALSGDVTLNANQRYAIKIQYYENSGPANFKLNLLTSAASGSQESVIPASMLTQDNTGLPTGWAVSTSLDESNQYDRATAGSNSMVMGTAGGANNEYNYQDGDYKPSVNDDGHLSTNANGVSTLQGSDGSTTTYNPNGTIRSATKPRDGQNPASFKYDYDGGRITKITDGTSPNRYAEVLYAGNAACPAVPNGFVAAPDKMICLIRTSDGQQTQLQYANDGAGKPQLARLVKPGNEVTDFAYDGQGTGMIQQIRDDVANDAIRAGVRNQDVTATTQLTYDALGREASIIMPAATANATRQAHNYNFMSLDPLNPANTDIGFTNVKVANATEPNGFSRQVYYDKFYRYTKDTNIANLTNVTEWDPKKDLVLSTTDPAGLKSTTIYDYADRATDTYGPAPAAYFDTATRLPKTTPTNYATQVERQQTVYDGNIRGLEAMYYLVQSNHGSLDLGDTVMGRSTGINGTNGTNGDLVRNWGAATPYNQAWGVRLTGDILLPEAGNHTFVLNSNDGARLYVNDKLVIDDWGAGGYRSHGSAVVNAPTANTYMRIKVEYRDLGNGAGARLELSKAAPGGGQTTAIGNLLIPRYGLTTSQTSYDSSAAVGNRTTSTTYGTAPEVGLPAASTVDPGGLALATNSSYEAPSSTTFLRKTSQTLPGGTVTNYAHYGANETADNPCTTNVTEAWKQGALMKSRTEPGLANGADRVTTMVYDEAGRMVASRYNNEPWSCYSYDARSRTLQETIPAFNGAAARTVTYDYGLDANGNAAANGNPLVQRKTDSEGTIATTYDLLGRSVQYSNAYNETTDYSYDTIGRLSGTNNTYYGNETYVYNNLNRLTEQKLDGTTLATVSYDAFGRMSQVTYPNAGSQKLELLRDAFGRVNQKKYTLGDGTTTISDAVTYSQSGQVISSLENGMTRSYGYDKAGRLTSAAVGSTQFSYGFDTPTNCGTGTNANAGKNSNRTSQTRSAPVASYTTTYCYNAADQLVSSSDNKLTNPVYDPHGNTLSLGAGSEKTVFWYDSSDRNTAMIQNNGAVEAFYSRDADDRVKYRSQDNNGANQQQSWYGYMNDQDSAKYVHRADWGITDKFVSLPGDVLLTIKPFESGNNQKVYSLTNIHGDTFVTTNTAGTSTGTYHYDPFGTLLSGTDAANGPLGTSFGYLGTHQKQSNNDFALKPQQMGKRIYIPALGRFLSVDSMEGGSLNRYAYPTDPVNGNDLDGMFWRGASQVGIFAASAVGTAALCAATAGAGCVLGAAAIGAASSAGSNAVGQVGNGKKFDTGSLVRDTAIGGALGAVGGRGINGPNNVLRAYNGRVAAGPAKSHYNSGSIASKNPYHFEISGRNKKVFLENVKTNRTIFCKSRGAPCY